MRRRNLTEGNHTVTSCQLRQLAPITLSPAASYDSLLRSHSHQLQVTTACSDQTVTSSKLQQLAPIKLSQAASYNSFLQSHCHQLPVTTAPNSDLVSDRRG
ncbi:proline-rich proteoglycan 2 [Biomphalaria pfeifferi]|uniref:Proline-rich proteoglycan 2 n=1 Tax=Biomphalaria pfeifferi TaxID=112525 RepID=A0AAD8FL77_BIOPF|nr:proline-rich proteoglycan 2 [Biomphalaria pfeifferi]